MAVDPTTLNKSTKALPNHTVKPVPKPGNVSGLAGGVAKSAKTISGLVGSAATKAAAAIPAPTAPPPASAPVPTVNPTAAPSASDPYAGLPPDSAALLQSQDVQAQQQAQALQQYFDAQQGRLNTFLGSFGQDITGLAQLGNIPGAVPTGSTGQTDAYAQQLNTLGGQMLGVQGFNLANSAPAFASSFAAQGPEALSQFWGNYNTNKGNEIATILDTLQKTQATEQAAQTRADATLGAAQLGAQSREKVAQLNNTRALAVAKVNYLLGVAKNATVRGDAQTAANARLQASQIAANAGITKSTIDASSRQAVANTNAAAKIAAVKAKGSGPGGLTPGEVATNQRAAVKHADTVWNGTPKTDQYGRPVLDASGHQVGVGIKNNPDPKAQADQLYQSMSGFQLSSAGLTSALKSHLSSDQMDYLKYKYPNILGNPAYKKKLATATRSIAALSHISSGIPNFAAALQKALKPVEDSIGTLATLDMIQTLHPAVWQEMLKNPTIHQGLLSAGYVTQ